MANINSVDFGSESEDGEDFNPPAQAGSDEDVSDEEVAVKSRTKSASHRASATAYDHDEDDDRTGEEQSGNRRAAQDEDEDEDEEDGRAGRRDDDDDEDQGVEDEDDDEEVTDRPRKRARRDPRNQYIDIEAEVDDEDEADEEDEEEGLHGDFIARDHPDDLADLPQGAETDDRRHRELDRKREMAAQLDAEEQAAQLRERHRKRQVTSQQVSQLPRRMLLPGVDDPSIWGVRCKPGKEREVIFSILKRLEDRANSKTPLPIFSAFERGTTSMSGYIYVEARKQSDVVDSLDGLLNVYPRTNMVLVAIKERPDLLRVQQSEQLQPGGYVRIKRGKYQGDLAQIDDVESNGLVATLRVVPRLDYGLNEDSHGPVSEGVIGPDGKRKRPGGFGMNKAAARPPQRLFSETEARKKTGSAKHLTSISTFDKKQWTYHGETYLNGFLIKDFKIQHLQTQNVNPTLEEVTRFAAGSEDGTENLDLTALAASLKNNTSSDSYLPGDTVEVYEGEQQGITGKATSVRGDIVTLTVTEGELRGRTLDVPMKGLRKRFREGDHVKIIGGSRFRDEVGMVVRIKDDKVTLVSDLTMQEITVFSKDLREATDTGAAGGLGLYDIHDLVQLDAATVGCVTKVDRESLRILDQNGTLRTLMPSQISNKIDRRRHAVATDRNGAEIRQDDTIKEVGGENRQGTILHIHRSFLFCHNREQPENSGIFVVRASNVTTVAAKGGRVASQTQTGPDLSRMNPAMQRQNGRGGPGGQNGAMAPPKTFGRDPTVGKTVNIRKGPYKGLLGIVRDTTDNEARIELHTKNKIIQVSKDSLGFKDPISGATLSYSDFTGRGRGRGMSSGGSTPMRSGSGYGGATPSRDGWSGGGGQTPLGGRDGGRTPAWGMAGGRTPAWGGGSSGGGGGDSYSRSSSARTPAWGGGGGGGGGGSSGGSGFGGGRTPAWSGGGGQTAYGGTTYNSGSRTPAWGGDGSRTSYGDPTYGSGSGFGGSGGRTPAYNPDGGRTPGYGNDAPTPASDPWARPTDAPTPAGGAPTPGAGWKDAPTPRDAPTPGGYGGKYAYDAPTPAAGAPTPYGGGPETPAAWGGDDDEDTGPRYVDDDD